MRNSTVRNWVVFLLISKGSSHPILKRCIYILINWITFDQEDIPFRSDIFPSNRTRLMRAERSDLCGGFSPSSNFSLISLWWPFSAGLRSQRDRRQFENRSTAGHNFQCDEIFMGCDRPALTIRVFPDVRSMVRITQSTRFGFGRTHHQKENDSNGGEKYFGNSYRSSCWPRRDYFSWKEAKTDSHAHWIAPFHCNENSVDYAMRIQLTNLWVKSDLIHLKASIVNDCYLDWRTN